MDKEKILYWIATGLMCAIFCFSASMYFTKTEMVRGFFESLNYPTYLVIPLAIAKLLGVIAVLTRFSRVLTEWAYAGFFLDAVLAFTAHWVAQDGGYIMSLVAIVATLASRFMYGRLYS